ncbi:LysR substrate-binding domain-containing protein [Saccharopolyspora spinosa]|uniref:LysR family transcriptional regulator n=1 Tax=Saccharopolyspora spinosa TaxID=60894 RepID=A0A2N3XVS3_SACSN|nr:LysR substrate-binding domain-containing protein [Saccharopolyspora spinosa]PKW14777.1 LysR family transcriptional regulator [Saccharopolyspora spinosa]
MDIAHLRDFITVVDSGSLTRAAAQLYVSQPALSQRIAHLESELGVRLLERGPRGVTPTAAGRALYRDAQQLVRQFDRIAGDVLSGDRIHGPVAVGLPTTVSVRLAPALFSWTKAHHPGIHLQLFESMSGYIQELLALGRLDLAVLYRDDDTVRPAETLLYSEDLFLIGQPKPPAADENEIGLVDLQNTPLVVPGGRSNLRELIDRAFTAQGLVPSIVADVDSLGAMIRIAASGEACTILPLSSVAEQANHRELGVRRIRNPVISRSVAVCNAVEYYPARDAVAAVREGISVVTRQMAAAGEWPGIQLA